MIPTEVGLASPVYPFNYGLRKSDHCTSTVTDGDKQPTVVSLLLTTPGDDYRRGQLLSIVDKPPSPVDHSHHPSVSE